MRFSNNTKLLISVSNNPTNFGVTIYNYLFEKLNMNCVYLPIKISNASQVVSSIKSLNIYGCSISSPLKHDMFLIADEVDAVATNLKNINTLKNDSGTLKGFNTDYYGFNKLITGKQLSNALIYGYGSVANTINFCLQEYGVKDIYIAGRNEERLEHFIKNKNLKKHKSNMNYDLLVNATPSGDKGDEVIDLLKYSNYLIDLNVKDENNYLIKSALSKNIPVNTGSEMSIYQLQKQFEIYFNQNLETELLNESLNFYLDSYS